MEPSIQLLHRWQIHRDPDAFAELVSRYGGLVYATCLRVARDASLAEDTAQECFIDLLYAGARIRSVPGWLHTTATRRTLDRIKADRCRVDRESRFAATQPSAEEPAWDDISDYLDEAIEALPLKLREPITLRFLQGRAYPEISVELSLPVSTIQYRLKIGIERIRRHLAERGVFIGAAALAVLVAAPPTHALPVGVAGYLGKLALAGQSAAPAAAAGTPVISAIGGIVAMNKLVAAAVVAAAAASVWFVVDKEPLPRVDTEVPVASTIDPGAAVDLKLADDTLLDYVQLKQQESRALLDNYARQYVFRSQSESRLKGMQSTQTRHLAVNEYKEGQRLRLEVEENVQGTNDGDVPEGVAHGPYRRLTHSLTTVNEREAAHWEEENGEISGNLTVWRHRSPSEMQHSAAGNVSLGQGIDLLDFAFGLRNSLGEGLSWDIASTREHLADLGTFRATEVERDGGKLIEITHEINGRIWLTATVDPARGYATTSIETNAYPDDSENIQRFKGSVSLDEVAEGVWAPAKMEASERYARPETDSQSNATVSFVVRGQTMNQHFEPEFFQWTTMNYPGVVASLSDLEGEIHLMKVKDGKLRFAPHTNESKLSPEAQARILYE
jgi:RNA polymerase sigma-70 factor (ECF subfamily)